MTRPNSLRTHMPSGGLTNQWRSRWLVPLVPAALGGVVVIAAATAGHLAGGLVWFAALVAVGGLSAFAERFETARRGHRPVEDEREAMINTRAMSTTGIVLVIVLTACIAFTLARGESTSPYAALIAVGGVSYVVALLVLRYRS
jgi:hypothetical protein